jgi:hypothetical protein
MEKQPRRQNETPGAAEQTLSGKEKSLGQNKNLELPITLLQISNLDQQSEVESAQFSVNHDHPAKIKNV